MDLNNIKKIISEQNPLTVARRNAMRINLINREVSFLVPNCIGGLLFHDLGLQFQSPTVNLMLDQRDFVRFILHLDEYLAMKLDFFKHPEYSFPCAYLGDLTIYFTHYTSEADAEAKWHERANRIRKENLFVFCEERDGLTKEEIESLATLNVKGLLVFTAHDYPDIPYALFIAKYAKDGEVGNIMRKSFLTGKREYESFFDFVKWFNEARGGIIVLNHIQS